MRDQLIDYLLNALDEEERACVERLLQENHDARRWLDILRHCLLPLQGDCEEAQAPDGLALRTCQRVRQVRIITQKCEPPGPDARNNS